MRPAAEPFDPRRYGVEVIPDDRTARAFVERHHYSGSLPASRLRLGLSLRWLPYVRQYGPPLLAVQDGIEPEAVEEHVGPGCGIFLGGSTAWKWSSLSRWAAMARVYRCHLHVGRVNSERGIRACRGHGVTSADGTSASRFAVNAPRLGAACRGPHQLALAC
jgi:hypothetical protein